jgi:thiol-disulfide isomerase/thioredoxin
MPAAVLRLGAALLLCCAKLPRAAEAAGKKKGGGARDAYFFGKDAKDNQPPKVLAVEARAVEELDAASLDMAKKAGSKLVMFYAPWCPHCQHYAPTWAKVGAMMSDLECGGKPARALAVNCVLQKTACQAEAISSYPTIKIIGPDGGIDKLDRSHTKDAASLLQYLSGLQAWGGCRHTTGSADSGGGTTPVLLPLKSPRTPSAPSPAPPPPPPPALAPEKKEAILAAKSLLPAPIPTVADLPPHGGAPPDGAAAARLVDVGEAVWFGLQNGVFAGRTALSAEEVVALRAWLRALTGLLPPALLADGALEAVRELAERPELTAAQWADGVEVAIDYLDEGKGGVGQGTWGLCADRAPHIRGYTCGLWLTFHTLAARAHDLGGGTRAADGLRALHGFVTHFFGCERCREHFLAAHPQAEIDGLAAAADARTIMLWLWAAHNDVSARLRRENAEEEEGTAWHLPVPAAASCAGCAAGLPPTPAISYPAGGLAEQLAAQDGEALERTVAHLVALYGFSAGGVEAALPVHTVQTGVAAARKRAVAAAVRKATAPPARPEVAEAVAGAVAGTATEKRWLLAAMVLSGVALCYLCAKKLAGPPYKQAAH